MNVFQFCGILVAIVCGVWLADVLGHRFGAASALLGLPIGIGLVIGMLWLLGYLLRRLTEWRPGLPDCRSGSCGRENYKYVATRGHGFVVECQKCGRKYWQIRPKLGRERRCMELLADGTVQPYLKCRHLFAPWKPDAGC